jgi:uncharacterized protein YdaU (DUF1376 family)
MAKDRPPPLPYTKFYYADFFRDEAVECMTNDEIGAYLRLMHAAHDAHPPGQIPSDPTYLASVSRMGTLWPAHSEAIARAFDTTSKPGFWVQKRIVREYSEARKQSVYGRIGAEVRWAAHRGAIGEANATLMHSKRLEVENRENLESKPLAEPVGSTVLELLPQETPPPVDDGKCTPAEWAEVHAEFYGSYPRKVKRPDSQRAWKKIKPQDDATFNAIMDGLEAWAAHWALKVDRDKIPYPATWLNARQWEDTP